MPALIFIVVLCVAAAIVWVNAVSTSGDITEAMTCEPEPIPPAGTTFTPLSPDALGGVTPVPPSQVDVRVLNANETRGDASMATEGLRRLGFDRVAEPGNDPVYGGNGQVAQCHGQIRFGSNGERSARTVQLLDPCLELIRDDRKGAAVDLVLGTNFNDLRLPQASVEILDRLKAWSAGNTGAETDEQSAGNGGPVLDEQLLADTVPEHC